jgi:hypothetical protein
VAKRHRRENGSILLLILFLVCFLLVPAIILIGQMGINNVGRVRTQSVVEAAGLVAANDLSRIIINDPNFGYVALSNYPPIGKATCAPDGEPLPVVGINTLVGTVRQNTIIAHELGNVTMISLAETDRTRMEETIKELNATIKAALTTDGKVSEGNRARESSRGSNGSNGSGGSNGSKVNTSNTANTGYSGINANTGCTESNGYTGCTESNGYTGCTESNGSIRSNSASGRNSKWIDIYGAQIQPVDDVTAFLKANLPKDVTLESVKLTNGWLSDGGDSTVALPQPLSLAQVKPQAIRAGKYRAFTDIPAASHSFTFAGLGPSSSLVGPATFHEADAKHICSIVKIECIVTLKNTGQTQLGTNAGMTLQTVACSQPFAMPEAGPTGAMTLRFSGGPVSGLQNWRDFLAGGFHDTQINNYEAVGGDYPVDHGAQIIASTPQLQPNTSQLFAEHLYYWLRNGHLRPRIDAVLAMINDSFRSGPAQIYAYEFAKDGSISRRIIARDPFPIGVTSDAQSQTVVDTSIQGGLNPIIIFRDDVKNLGTVNGGQHAGQPLAGYPLNWCELADYGGDEHLAAGLDKGRLGTRLTVVDPSGAAVPEEAINNPIYNLFQTFEGKHLSLQPRRSFYSGGLALDIEIGGTSEQPPLSAVLNIPSKRYILAHRKI